MGVDPHVFHGPIRFWRTTGANGMLPRFSCLVLLDGYWTTPCSLEGVARSFKVCVEPRKGFVSMLEMGSLHRRYHTRPPVK